MKNLFNWEKFNENKQGLSLKDSINNQRKIVTNNSKDWQDDEDICDWMAMLTQYGYYYDADSWDIFKIEKK
jgi:N-acetyl-anhydromuramyl-L-alanine amidase AmpD